VVRAVLKQGHLPEAGFAWEEAVAVALPAPRAVRRRPLVRRLEDRPAALPPKPFRERDDCWIATAAGDCRVEAMTGPYVVSGGWWRREVHREYHYAATERGELLWVYYDRPRRRWFLAGKVE
jgi:protein ImuB